jgi:hypothetical protein
LSTDETEMTPRPEAGPDVEETFVSRVSLTDRYNDARLDESLGNDRQDVLRPARGTSEGHGNDVSTVFCSLNHCRDDLGIENRGERRQRRELEVGIARSWREKRRRGNERTHNVVLRRSFASKDLNKGRGGETKGQPGVKANTKKRGHNSVSSEGSVRGDSRKVQSVRVRSDDSSDVPRWMRAKVSRMILSATTRPLTYVLCPPQSMGSASGIGTFVPL